MFAIHCANDSVVNATAGWFWHYIFTKRKNTMLFVQLHQYVECVLGKDLSHCYKVLFMVNEETEETL